jgi:transposase
MQAMLPAEIAQLYNVSVRTLKNWLKPFNKEGQLNRNNTRYYTPKQVQYIFECFGEPENNLNKNDKEFNQYNF